ncbi:hypothetical protein Q0M94_24900 (plasmid) [Deinococcus radiomollis]|uniref:hypothetical protein n=1 Tax=Deinococcus radiomollis TaxID=468916 RepID=UPI003891A4E8
MKSPEQALIAVDASALGAHAAFGAVLLLPDGTRLEVSGPLPRSEYQEVTSALAALHYLPAGMPASLHLDAQAEVLRASLTITHPWVHVVQIPRNSTREHERAHDLARAALKASAPRAQAPSADGPQLAVYAFRGVESGPKFAVAYWQGGEIEVRTGEVPVQPTKAQTLTAIQVSAQAFTPPGMELVIAAAATARRQAPGWNVTREQLTAMRRQAEKSLVQEFSEPPISG